MSYFSGTNNKFIPHFIPHFNVHLALVKTFVLSLLISISFITFASPCDQHSLQRANDSVVGYKERNGICEGLYSTDVSSGFELVSLEEVPVPVYKKGDVLTLIHPDLPANFNGFSLRVSGVAMRPETYYRMDAEFSKDKNIEWPVKILTAEGITLENSELGIYGWFNLKNKRLYYPIAAQLNEQAIEGKQIRMVLRAGVPIQQIKWQLIVNDVVVSTTKMRGGIAVGRPIPIDIEWPSPRPNSVKIKIIAKQHQKNRRLTPIFELAVPISETVTAASL